MDTNRTNLKQHFNWSLPTDFVFVSQDLLIHLRDCSHPEFEAQKVHVLDVLKMLKLPKYLLENIIEVHNKVDLRYNAIKTKDNVYQSWSKPTRKHCFLAMFKEENF